jgi:hypothetical protein
MKGENKDAEGRMRRFLSWGCNVTHAGFITGVHFTGEELVRY